MTRLAVHHCAAPIILSRGFRPSASTIGDFSKLGFQQAGWTFRLPKQSNGMGKARAGRTDHERIHSDQASSHRLAISGRTAWLGDHTLRGQLLHSKKYLRRGVFKPNFIPGICPYKFLYVWMDLSIEEGGREKNLGWLYWLPNPFLPFIWFRVALPGAHPSLVIERFAEKPS
jgi:hypothetical protein